MVLFASTLWHRFVKTHLTVTLAIITSIQAQITSKQSLNFSNLSNFLSQLTLITLRLLFDQIVCLVIMTSKMKHFVGANSIANCKEFNSYDNVLKKKHSDLASECFKSGVSLHHWPHVQSMVSHRNNNINYFAEFYV